MNEDLKNILSNLNKDIDQEKLLEYLSRNMPANEQHELEKQLNDDEFMSDAMDGLADMRHKDDVSLLVKQLNAGLQKQLDKNKKKRSRRPVMKDAWINYTIVLLMVLAVVAFIVIKKFMAG